MINVFRGNGAKVAVGIVIGFIALVFIFEGIFLDKSGGGMAGSIAGKVNGEVISLTDFNRAYEQKLNFMKGMLGDKITEEQLKMFKVRESAFQELAQRKILAQDAAQQGLQPSDAQVREKIAELPYFQKDGKFDLLTYRNLLEANRMNASQFEKTIREELLVQEWMRSLGTQVQVSEAEAREDYLVAKTQRNVKFVSLPSGSPKKGDLTPSELAAKVAPLLKADKSSDAAVNALLKPYGVEVRSTELISRSTGFMPGIGDVPEVQKDAFATPSPIQGHAKVYTSGGQVIVALVSEAKEADPSQFEKEKKEYLAQTRTKKERALMEATMKKLTEKAKITTNEQIVGTLDPRPTG